MDPQMIRRIIFQCMRFIKDHCTVDGQGAVFLHFQFPDLEIGKKQRMIGHYDVRFIPGFPVFPVKTLMVKRAFRTEAVCCFAADALPEQRIKPETDLRFAAGLCPGCPGTELQDIIFQ